MVVISDCPDMTSAVYCGRKTTNQTKTVRNIVFDAVFDSFRSLSIVRLFFFGRLSGVTVSEEYLVKE